jgi:MFS transporter, PPP family, 3-phenylpropionic acid transporter
LSRLPPFARFVVLYAALYAAFGTVSPFLPAYFADRGLTAQQIAMVVGLGTVVRLVSAPLVGRLADGRRIWRGALAVCLCGAGALALAYLWANGFGQILLAGLAQSVALAPLAPLADSLALSASLPRTGRGFEYGHVRGAGSAAFVAGSLVAGHIALSRGLAVAIWLNAFLLGAAALAALQVPDIPDGRPMRHSGGARDFFGLLRLPAFRRLLLTAALVLGSHALHDTFAVIRWRQAGITTAAASLLWSESVVAEVAVFLLAGPALLRRLGPAGAALLAACAGAIRWSVLGATAWIVPLMLAEPLHGLTFALFHLAAMRVIGATVPRRLAATAQALYATASGVAVAALTLASGLLYTWFDGRAFFAMAILCIAAVPLAARMMR